MTKITKGNEVLLVCGRDAGKRKAIVTRSGSKYIHVKRVNSAGEPQGRELQFEAKTFLSTTAIGARDYIIPNDKIQEYGKRDRLIRKQTLVTNLLKERLPKLEETEVDKLIEILIRE